jgi:hypothetical protein
MLRQSINRSRGVAALVFDFRNVDSPLERDREKVCPMMMNLMMLMMLIMMQPNRRQLINNYVKQIEKPPEAAEPTQQSQIQGKLFMGNTAGCRRTNATKSN